MKLTNKLKTMIYFVLFTASMFQSTGCKLASEDICQEEERSTRSDCTELRDVTPPVVNSGIEIASVTSSSIVLSWGAASDNVTEVNRLRYKLVVANQTDAIDSLEDAIRLPSSAVLLNFVEGQTSYEYIGLSPSTQYAFAVVVTDLEGNLSLYQPVSQATWDPNVSKPASFSLVEAKAGEGEVTLSWNKAEGASSYIIRRGTASGLYSTIARVDSSPFTDKELSSTTKYYYMVTAENAGGWTNATNELTATPVSLDRIRPTLLSLSPNGGTVRSTPTEIVASFSEAMTPLTTESITVTSTGCSVVPTVTGITSSDDATTWTASLSSGTCANAAQLSVTITPSNLTDLVGNIGDGAAVTNTFVYNKPTPLISFGAPSASYIRNGLSVTIDATFFDAISTTLSNGSSGVSLAATGGASCTASLSSVTLSGARVTVSNCTGDGTVQARLGAGVITAEGGISNPDTIDSGIVTVDNTAPSVTLTPYSGSPPFPTAIDATFSEAVTNVSASSFTIGNLNGCPAPGPTVTGVSGSADKKIWTVNLNLNGCTDNGTDSFSLTVGTSTITDLAGNALDCPVSEQYGVGCFVGHTLIITPTGQRPLQDLRPGDAVLSHNLAEGRDEVAFISEVTFHNVSDVTTLIHHDERVLIGASRHRLISPSGKSTTLRQAQSRGFKVADTRLVKAPVLMYDLILDRNHNFYANDFLVESIKPRAKLPGNKASRSAANFCLARR